MKIANIVSVLLLLLILFVFLSPLILYLLSKKTRVITIKRKLHNKNMIVDKDNRHYLMSHLWWILKDIKPLDYQNIKVNKTYKVYLFGINLPSLNALEHIYAYEEI